VPEDLPQEKPAPPETSPGLTPVPALPERSTGYDLRLMPWGDGSGVPTSGNRVIVVGTDLAGLLHIRIFDTSGIRVTDTDETQLPGTQAGAISALKQQLPGLLPPHVLTDAEQAQVLQQVTTILGQTRTTGPVAGNPHVATSYLALRRSPPTYAEQLQRKTFSQTVDEARRTMFGVAQNPRPTAVLPTGRRSVFTALSKARQDMNAANLRRARQQGQVPPMPAPADPGAVEPGSSAPVVMPAPGEVMMAPAPGPVPEAAVADPGPMSNAEPSPSPSPAPAARRGLVGMLFGSRDH